MIPKSKTWYKEIWTLDIKQQSWTEQTKQQVDFLIQTLELTGRERILDLACGFGRHSLEFARRGFDVTGVDITDAYIQDASRQASKEGLSARFLKMDIREVPFREEFDVVLNLADGAIGYLETDAENEKIFDVVANALRPGGKHILDVMSADYADTHFPCNLWDMGEHGITLSRFEWDRERQILLYGQNDFVYGEALPVPKFDQGDPIRLYHLQELRQLLEKRRLCVVRHFCDYTGTPGTENASQILLYSQKREN